MAKLNYDDMFSKGPDKIDYGVMGPIDYSADLSGPPPEDIQSPEKTGEFKWTGYKKPDILDDRPVLTEEQKEKFSIANQLETDLESAQDRNNEFNRIIDTAAGTGEGQYDKLRRMMQDDVDILRDSFGESFAYEKDLPLQPLLTAMDQLTPEDPNYYKYLDYYAKYGIGKGRVWNDPLSLGNMMKSERYFRDFIPGEPDDSGDSQYYDLANFNPDDYPDKEKDGIVYKFDPKSGEYIGKDKVGWDIKWVDDGNDWLNSGE